MKLATKNKKGFSLIELLVAMAISIIVILTVVAAFASVVKTRNNAQTSQQNLEDARSVMELMAKTLRMSSDVKVSGTGNNTISFYNSSTGNCVSYKNDGGVIKMDNMESSLAGQTGITPENACDGISYNYLPYTTSAQVDPTNGLSFNNLVSTSGTAIGKVTILMIIGGQHLETTVSFRDYFQM